MLATADDIFNPVPAWAHRRARGCTATGRLGGMGGRAGWQVSARRRFVDTPNALAAQERLGRHRIWSRVFPNRWLRLGLPAAARARLEAALES